MGNMKKDMERGYELLRNILQDAFGIAAVYFTYPYGDLRKIDQGMRAAVWPDYNQGDTKVSFSGQSAKYRLLVIRSNLGFYNLLVTFAVGEHPDFISVGPFRDEELSPVYFGQILREAKVGRKDIERMRQTYERMPLAAVDAVTNVVKHIVGTFITEFELIEPEQMQYAEHKREVEVNSDLLDEYSPESAELYQRKLMHFLDMVKTGDQDRAKKALQEFFRDTNVANRRNMQNYKMFLQALNNFCHMALLQTTVHPLHLLRQSNLLGARINSSTSQVKLEQMPMEICRKYCLLVKNYANPEYSKLTKAVISYIQFHLEEELSLSYLADYFHKQPSVLSNTFSKETKQSLTKFIHQTRVQEAIRLFNVTDMSVSEVALAVGYQDFSYFSKVFSRQVGQSPRAYRQQKNVLEKE